MGSQSAEFAALNLQIGKLAYDPDAQVVWMRFQLNGDSGIIEGLSGLHPTNVGSIQIHCYSPVQDLQRNVPVFSAIIRSLRMDEELKYQERSALSQSIGSLGDIGKDAVKGVVIGGLIAVVMGFLRKRKQQRA